MKTSVPKRKVALGALVMGSMCVGAMVPVFAFELGANADQRTVNGVPLVIPFQGSFERDGTRVSESLAMGFALFEQSTGGQALWTSSARTVAVDDGHFAVTLGDGNDTTPIPDATFSENALYIEVTVQGTPLTPRQRIAPSPHAITAARAMGRFTVPLDLTAGEVRSSGALLVDGDTTLGDGPGDTTTVNGALVVDRVEGGLTVDGELRRQRPGGAELLGTFCGSTSPTDGSFVDTSNNTGYVAAKNLCVSACGGSPTAHMCSSHEVSMSLQHGMIPNTQNTDQFWVSSVSYTIDRTQNDITRDCVGWQTTTQTNGRIEYAVTIASQDRSGLGRVLTPELSNCTEQHRIACCD